MAVTSTFTSNGLSPAVLDEIKEVLVTVTDDLDRIQQMIHDNPETAWQEKTAHDVCTTYMEQKGFKVKRSAYNLSTAWEATWSNGAGGPGTKVVGHACGHNQIAIVGMAAAIGAAEIMKRRNISGKVLLLGTPAEESGGGKTFMVKAGAYDEMDVCMMSHPMGRGKEHGIIGLCCTADFSAHPDKGVNALDAAVAAYSNLALLRQQIGNTDRVYTTIKGSEEWSANVIPCNSYMLLGVRAVTARETYNLINRALNCIKGAATATGCEVEILREGICLDTQHSEELAKYHQDCNYDPTFASTGATDFGDVSYKVPALHPYYCLPDAAEGDAPHSDTFAKWTRLRSSTDASMQTAASIAALGVRALVDAEWTALVRSKWEQQMERVDGPQVVKNLEALMDEYPQGVMDAPPEFVKDGCNCGH